MRQARRLLAPAHAFVAVLVAAVVGLAGVLLPAVTAYACDCSAISPAQALRQSDAAFLGRLVEKTAVSTRGAGRMDLRFEVERVYKGAVHRDQVVATSGEPTSCGLDPAVDSSWVIFAVEAIEDRDDRPVNRLTTTLCSGNLPGNAAPTLLGDGREPLAGASDRAERAYATDRAVTRGFAVVGIAALSLASLALLGLIALWRPGRSPR